MWVRHGNLTELDTLGGTLTAAGQLTALLGTYLVLIQLALMARSPWLDQVFGSDRLVDAHRWIGYGAVALLAGHVGPSLTYADAFATAAFAMGRDGVAWLADRPGYEALAITDDERLVWTPGMDALLA